LQGSDLTGADLTRSWIRQVGFSNARMEDVQFGELPYLEEDTRVYACAYSPNGKMFAVALEDESIKLYDTGTWKMIHQLRGHEHRIPSIAFSPCSKRLVSGSFDCTVRLWDCETGLSSFVLEDHTDYVIVAYSPTGRQVASAGDDTEVRLWDPDRGDLIFVLTGHTDRIYGLVFSPDGRWLASGSVDKTIRLYDTQTATPGTVLSTTLGIIFSIALSPDGQRIAAGQSNQVQLFNTVTGEPCLVLPGHTGTVAGLSFSPSGQWIVTACDDNMARLWDAQTGTLVSVFAGHSLSITGMTFAPDGTHLATSGSDGTIRHWELNLTGLIPDSQDHSDPVTSVACSHDARWIISSRNDGTIQQYDADTGEPGFIYPGKLHGAQHVACSPTGPLFASVGYNDTNEVKVWNAETGALHFKLLGHTDTVYNVAFSPCGHWIASCSRDKTIRLWDVRTGTHDRIFEGHTDAIYHLAFSPDGCWLVSCSWDKPVRVWELASGESRILYVGLSNIFRVTYSPRDQQIATLDTGKEACILDDQTGEVLHTLQHMDDVYCLQYSSCGEWLATGGHENMSIWKLVSVGDSEKWEEVVKVGGLSGFIIGVAWKPHNLELVTGCNDGSVRVWRISETPDGFSARLVWSAGYAVLVASNANLIDAIGLSATNRRLLEQRGAIVESTAE
ncbi:hypothetical protein BGX23_000253, partial [Mortierella sp. AD031]